MKILYRQFERLKGRDPSEKMMKLAAMNHNSAWRMLSSVVVLASVCCLMYNEQSRDPRKMQGLSLDGRSLVT
jgi:hypothetical protein